MEIEAKHPTQTKVHLQVYDGCAHVLPILFAFTTPAKFCFRAIANFCRFATGMQSLSPGPPSPVIASGSVSSQQKSFFGGSLFTSPPEEIGDLLTERKGKKSGRRGGEKDPSMSTNTSGTGQVDKEKQRSDGEKPKEKTIKEKRENSKGESKGEKNKVKVEANSEGSKEEVQKGSTDHPVPRKLKKGGTRAEMVGKVEAAGDGSPPVGEDKTDEVRTMDQQLKAGTAGNTQDDIARSLGDVKSFSSSNSSKSTNQSQGSTKPGKRRWSLMITRRSTPEQIPIPGKKFTEDVGGPRFAAAKKTEGERCAGDYPPIYVDGFVSPISSSHVYVS